MKNFLCIFTRTRLIWFLVVGIFLNLSYIAYLAFYPFKTVSFNNLPFPVLDQPVHAGDALLYEADYCRYTKVPSHLTRTLIGPTVITIAEDTSITDVGCRKIKVKNTVIPSYAPPGTYYLKITVCYQVTPLHNICHEIRTIDFKVIEPKE